MTRLGAGTLPNSRFDPYLQVGEHDLHFVSKVRQGLRREPLGSRLSPHFRPFPSPLFSPHSIALLPLISPLCLQIQLFSRPDFLGDHFSFEDDQAALPASFRPQSCRVHGGR